MYLYYAMHTNIFYSSPFCIDLENRFHIHNLENMLEIEQA